MNNRGYIVETELARTILNMPYDVYKSFNYVTNHIDAYTYRVCSKVSN